MGVTGAQQEGNEQVARPDIRARLADESGSSLIFVLIFIMGFSVMITALLGFSSTALTANKRATDVARQLEAADAGVELALEMIRAGAASVAGTPAPTATTLTATVNNDRVTATVTQRVVKALCIGEPFGTAPGVATYRVGTAANACPADDTLPYGATWSITSGTGGTIDQRTGKLQGTPGETYNIRAQLGNVSATKVVTLPTPTPSPTPPP